MTYDWNVSSVVYSHDNHNQPTIKIKGFDPNKRNSCFESKITKTTLANALLNPNYNEGYNISVVNPNEVYVIHIGFYSHVNEYMDMNSNNYVSIYESKYLDENFYMGLPSHVFSQWRGSMITK
jgi:hypothetical protein